MKSRQAISTSSSRRRACNFFGDVLAVEAGSPEGTHGLVQVRFWDKALGTGWVRKVPHQGRVLFGRRVISREMKRET
jgi:hypothetical protein